MTAVNWLLTEMTKMQYYIGNDLLIAIEKAVNMEHNNIENAYAEGSLNRADFEYGRKKLMNSRDYMIRVYGVEHDRKMYDGKYQIKSMNE